MRVLHVNTRQRDYDVLVGNGTLPALGGALWLRVPGGRVVLVTDENVASHYAVPARESLRDAGYDVSEVVLPAGEAQKSLARAQELYGVLYERHLRRTDTVVALGGGVIGDLAGFVAATFQRGVRLAQVPTTLLAQVDAAVGGKVAVDFRGGKNYVGTFYQPTLVVADPGTFATLPVRELRNGAAEVVKYGFLRGGELLDRVRAAVPAHEYDADLVAACVAVKAEIVERDEREEDGERQLLNLGHTVGHAIEAAGGFSSCSHGEAVALGLRAALWLSQVLTGLSEAEAAEGQALLSWAGLPERLPGAEADEVVALVARDKKASPEGVGHVLLEGFGRPVRRVRVAESLLREVVTWLATR